MTTTRLALALLVALVAAAPTARAAPAAEGLEVTGALPRTGTISLAELKKLPPAQATWTSRGAAHAVTGVALDVLLAKQGFDRGVMGKDVAPHDKRRGWHKVVVASARDGFVAVLSCAEVFEDMGATRAIVAWEIDGKPLPADKGPLRLVVLTDKEPSRSVYALARIDVIDVAADVTLPPSRPAGGPPPGPAPPVRPAPPGKP